MNILINARVLNERRGGPARYTYNILKELARVDKRNTYHILLYNELDLDFRLPGNFITKIYRTKSKILFDYIYLPLYSWKNRIGISLYPKNTFSPFVKGKKLPFFNDIVYFEKLGFREFKFFDNLHHTLMIPVSGKFSFLNLSISDFTASRMKELLRIPDQKIRIIKLGIEESFRHITSKKQLDAIISKHNLQRPFFFYAGSLSPRKNMLNVLRAFINIKDKVPHCIYFTAGDSWRDIEVFRLIEENGLHDRVVKLGFLSDEELVLMYNLADAYLYPSLYEGFGLPILEAQACGCPVITSSVSSCPEVAGDGALIVDPYKIEDISAAMLKIAKDKAYRKKLIEKGYKNSARYSWKKTTQVLLSILKEAGAD